ncbi:MAG: hypothetical protein HC890_06670 [Chloroflexaceae bacterium]|nr:hypothetical protein [Chloroflexaceae bacterium]
MIKPLKLAPYVGAALAAWFFGYIYNVYQGGLISWLRAMYENKVAIAAEIQGPQRLLIVGGSGAHYTINSQLLEQELGFPVFNFGLDGNLGLDVIFPTILEQIRPGDIVLVIPEYLMLLDSDGLGERSAAFGLAIGQPGLGNIPPKLLAQDTFSLGVASLRSLVKTTNDLLGKGEITEYYSDPLTPWGDPTRTYERETDWWQLKITEPVTPHSLKRIAQFRQELEAKGATLILSMPVIYGSSDPTTRKNVEITARELGKIAPLIYDPETYNVSSDPSLFADTHYHLKPEGRRLRALEVAEQLGPVLKGISPENQ